jgi:hypothetical protein
MFVIGAVLVLAVQEPDALAEVRDSLTNEHKQQIAQLSEADRAYVKTMLEHGNIPKRNNFAIGFIKQEQVAFCHDSIFIELIINENEFLSVERRFAITGIATEGKFDNSVMKETTLCFYRDGTKKYLLRTVPHIVAFDPAKAEVVLQKILAEKKLRVWTLADGISKQVATLRRATRRGIQLQLPDGKPLTLKPDQLSETDRKRLEEQKK